MAGPCVFCRIIRKEIPSRIIFNEDEIISFEDLNPQAPIHVLVIPKRHITSLSEIKEQDVNLVGQLFWVAHRIAKERGLSADGYRALINTGPAGGQTVDHIHVHLLGGRQMTWPPG